jgi:Xaa-Pro aminopeptidase
MNPILDAERSITEQECRQRTARVQQFAAEHGLGAVVAFSLNRYAVWNQTGHVGYIVNWNNLDRTAECAVVIPVEGDPVLLYCGLPTLEPQIHRVSWVSDVRRVASPDPGSVTVSFSDPLATSEPPNSYGNTTKQILSERGLAGRPVGLLSPGNLPHGVYLSFKRGLGDGLREDVPDIIAALRAVKSPAEIALHRKAAALCDLGYEVLFREAKAGRWGHEVVAHAIAAMRVEGADYAHFWMRSCPPERFGHMIDQRPHDRLLENGDQLEAGAYAVYAGYWMQALRCGAIGRPHRATEEIAAVISQMVDAACAAARPGLRSAGPVDAAGRVAERAGYHMPVRRVGHGQGLDYSERPFLGEKATDIFQLGNVFVFHPQVDDPDTGLVRLPLGETFVMTENGPEPLTKFPREPFIVH